MSADNLTLEHGEIHLWLSLDREITQPELLAAYQRLLTPEERQQAQRFHFARDRHQYLITRALVRSVLAHYATVAAADWRFQAGQHGRPQILNPQGSDLTFNISHTAGLIALAVTRRGELGVDVENIIDRSPPLEISRRYFSVTETSDLHTLPQALQAERFFHYWTLKESYIKARSMGLSLPLEQFSFRFPGANGICLGFSDELSRDDLPENWHFWLLQPGPEYVLALCARNIIESPGSDDAPPPAGQRRILLRRHVPLCPPAAPQSIDSLLLRQSSHQRQPLPAHEAMPPPV